MKLTQGLLEYAEKIVAAYSSTSAFVIPPSFGVEMHQKLDPVKIWWLI